MADISDVESALGAVIAQAVYPRGLSGPSVTGAGTTVKIGWPLATQLGADLKVGTTTVSVFPLQMERNTTRYLRHWTSSAPPSPTLTLALDGQTITIGGTVPVPFVEHNLAVLIAERAYTYAVQQSDTLTSIATALASQISGASSVGPVVILPEPIDAILRVGTIGEAVQELKRQERVVQITVWAPSPETRTAAATAIDSRLADTAFLTMPDGTAARVKYLDSPVTDNQSKARVYRRDLRYMIDYATTKVQDAAEVTVGRVVRETQSISDY